MIKKLLSALLTFFLLFILGCDRGERTPEGSVHVHFSAQQGIEWVVAQEIDNASETIDAAVYNFTSRPLAQALVDAVERGIAVRVIIDPSNASASYSKAAYLVKNDIPVRTEKGMGLMHHKFALIDDTVLITGSYNWTASAETANDENILLLKGFPRTCRAYAKEFERIWHDAGVYTGKPVKPSRILADDKKELERHVGERVLIQGQVKRVGYSERSNTYFLDFSTGRDGFTAVIFSSAVEKFERLDISIEDYEGKEVEIRGELIDHPQYGLEIIVEEPSQIGLLP